MNPLTNADIERIRQDFPMFDAYPSMQGKRFCYLDNSATTFKPKAVIAAQDSYYESWTANTHRGDYDLAHLADVNYRAARETVARFIHADPDEVVFTAGDTMGLNMVAFGMLSVLKPGDEILISDAEHASNVLPWFTVAKLASAAVKFIPLDQTGKVTPEAVKRAITAKTKVVSLAQVTNVLGSVVDAKACAEIAHNANALFAVDGAQSVPHMPIDVKDMDCDFLVFSGHKMVGPTGIGVMYGKKNLLDAMPPLLSGGGMNARFNECGLQSYEEPPAKFEAGTQNIAGAYGLAKACDYLSAIGLPRIGEWERHLKARVLDAIKGHPEIIVYNPDSPTGILDFNIKGVFAQDEATLLNHHGIAVRSGQHCAKILVDWLKTSATVRASFYLYNDEADADQLIHALLEGGDILDAYFA